jgi:hypothetical protein
MHEEPVDTVGTNTDDTNVSRRRMLRGAAVLAGTAGAAIGGMAVATPANAAPDGNVIMAPTNDAGGNTTGITNISISNPTLSLNNTATAPGTGTAVRSGPALQLTPSADILAPDAPQGSFSVSTDGTLWTITEPGFRDFVYNTFNASMIVPVQPTRVFDTRAASGRARIVNPAGNLDSLGRLIGGHRIDIDMVDFSFFSFGIFVNLTVVQPVADGFLSIFPWTPEGTFPGTSNINYSKSLFALSNFALTAAGHFVDGAGVLHDRVSIFANTTTHVLMDVSGFVVPSAGNVNQTITAVGTQDATSKSLRSAAQRRVKAPAWYKGQI